VREYPPHLHHPDLFIHQAAGLAHCFIKGVLLERGAPHIWYRLHDTIHGEGETETGAQCED
jgi:hypothetical protein